jgi:hypothetical protein
MVTKKLFTHIRVYELPIALDTRSFRIKEARGKDHANLF